MTICWRPSRFGHSPQVFDEIKADDWKAHLEGQYSIGHSRDPEGLENWADRFFEYHQTSQANPDAGGMDARRGKRTQLPLHES